MRPLGGEPWRTSSPRTCHRGLPSGTSSLTRPRGARARRSAVPAHVAAQDSHAVCGTAGGHVARAAQDSHAVCGRGARRCAPGCGGARRRDAGSDAADGSRRSPPTRPRRDSRGGREEVGTTAATGGGGAASSAVEAPSAQPVVCAAVDDVAADAAPPSNNGRGGCAVGRRGRLRREEDGRPPRTAPALAMRRLGDACGAASAPHVNLVCRGRRRLPLAACGDGLPVPCRRDHLPVGMLFPRRPRL